MFTYEYRFYPSSCEQQLDEFVDAMQWYLSSLYKNGQILSSFQNTVKYEDHFACRCVALEKDSLNRKYGNKYTEQFLENVAKRSRKPPKLQFIGENYDVEDCCACQSSSHYILRTDCQSPAPPVICGDCNRPVPLYRFPKTYDNSEYYDLLGWQKTYQACDRQFLEGIGERHGYKMMHDPNSALSRMGLQFCKLLEEKTQKPFYYYLFNYYSKTKPLCPNCGVPWHSGESDSAYEVQYDYVCHRCRLVSND